MDTQVCKTKTGKGCGKTKPTEQFTKRGDTYTLFCKECKRKEYNTWRINNLGKARANAAKWHKNNKEKANQKNRDSYTKHKEARKEKIRNFRKKYPEKCRANEAKYRTLKYSTSVDNTKHEMYLIECVYAFARFKTLHTEIQQHVDHIKPLAKGGLHHPSNLQILTATENMVKGNKY